MKAADFSAAAHEWTWRDVRLKAIIYEAICGCAKDYSGSPFNQTNTYRAPAIASADLK